MKPDSLAAQVAKFKPIRSDLEKVAGTLADELRRLVFPVVPHALVEARVKEVSSFAEKILRKKKYSDPLREITDLVGARIVTHLGPEADRVVEQLRQRFVVDERHSVNKARELRSGEFGYLSQHLVLVLEARTLPGAVVPESLVPLRVEVQVRTLLQHAWAAIGHDRLYKPGFQVPDRWQREAARIAARLESADADFVHLVEGVEAYQGEFGVYLKPEAIRQELDLVTQVQQHAKDNAQLAERRARLALSAGEWAGAKAIVEEFAESRRTAGLWCCLGLARCGLVGAVDSADACAAGISEFRRALETNPHHLEALHLLARSLEGDQLTEARECYGALLRLKPNDPRALAGCLRIAVRHQPAGVDLPLWSALAGEAIRRCEPLIEVGVNLVESLRLRALFQLIGDPAEAGKGLAALAEAILACRNAHELRELKAEFSALRALADRRPALEAAWRTASLALLARFSDSAELEEIETWAGLLCPTPGPVWILAGGCAPEAGADIAACRSLILPAFETFSGTVISGGTREGIGGLVGEAAAAQPGRFTSVGYLPIGLESGPTITPDERYTELRRKESGTAFSWNEPLLAWADILRSGIPARQVTLLGVNGGVIAAFEFRLAAALGARVGVIADSGRAAALLDTPGERRRFPDILRLPHDPATIQMFLERNESGLELPAETLERLAQRAHEEYLSTVPSRVDPSHEPWERLDEALKESNRDQVRRSVEVLRKAGFRIRPIAPGEKVREFSTEEIETLAEAEHARWVLERLEAGWQLAPEKDVTRRLSPHLIPWDRLRDEVKEWDRKAVRKLGPKLAEAGLQIVRAGR
ncbi:MAG: hypothetical protein KIT22_11705 [Verrucomicrobiae bacterium]|nr:hypothetical protein [Verrucomicrobiae bacterium]